MRLKYTLILAAILLICGLPDISQPKSNALDPNDVPGFETAREAGLTAADGRALKCSLQSKKSAVRRSGREGFAVSVNSDWICK